MKERAAYDLLRNLVAEHGGRMYPEKEGQSTGGAWIIEVAGMRTVFPWDNHSYPGIDDLYMPKPGMKPRYWWDYQHELIPDAWEKLLVNMKIDWIEKNYDKNWRDDLEK